MAEANSSDESLGGSSGVRSKRPKKKSKEVRTGTARNARAKLLLHRLFR